MFYYQFDLKSEENDFLSSRQLYWKPESILILVYYDDFLGICLALPCYFIINLQYLQNLRLGSMLTKGLLFVIMITIVTGSKSNVSELKYTQDIELFKKDNMRGRMELLLGCWLLSREFNPNTADQNYQLSLIKKCMQKITRKDSVVKVTSLIGKNMTVPKKYQDIVTKEEISQIMVGNLQASDFDKMLIDYIRSYEKDIGSIEKGKQGQDLKKKIDEEIAKRQKYYFGIIPANQYTHMLMLIFIAVLMVVICTCWKYYNRKRELNAQKVTKQGYFEQQKNNSKNQFTKSPKPKKA